MVWGICWPDLVGKYRPEGDFEAPGWSETDGWWPRMMRHFLEEMEEADKEVLRHPYYEDEVSTSRYYAKFVACKFDSELGGNPPLLYHPVTPIEPHEVPTSFMTQKTYPQLGDLIDLGGALAVCGDLAAAIEGLEPGVHKWFDIPIISPKGSHVEGYKLLVINNYFDAVVRDGVVVPKEGFSFTGPQLGMLTEKKYLRNLEFRKSEFLGVHLWRDRLLDDKLICVSDELMAAIHEQGFVIPKHAKMAEV